MRSSLRRSRNNRGGGPIQARRAAPGRTSLASKIYPIQLRSGPASPSSGADRNASGMPPQVQGQMEQAFGTDFSGVRIHESSPSAESMGALAYTQGSDIHFQPGLYQPGSEQGKELLGHELAHVVQQSEGRVATPSQAKQAGVNDDSGLEREADEMAAQAIAGGVATSARSGAAAPGNVIQRREAAAPAATPATDNNATDATDAAEPTAPGEEVVEYPGSAGEFSLDWNMPHEAALEEAGAEGGEEPGEELENPAAASEAPVQMRQTARQRAQARISTPLPGNATIRRNRSARVNIANRSGNATVTVNPDNRGAVGRNRAVTTINYALSGGRYWLSGGKVVRLTPRQVTFSIRTTYGPGARGSQRSAYGRGTTAGDVSSGNTSLRFHEGSHGTDFLAYLRTNPLPVFGGKKTQTKAQFVQATTTYDAAIGTYVSAMQAASVQSTDCVGTQGSMCRAVP